MRALMSFRMYNSTSVECISPQAQPVRDRGAVQGGTGAVRHRALCDPDNGGPRRGVRPGDPNGPNPNPSGPATETFHLSLKSLLS